MLRVIAGLVLLLSGLSAPPARAEAAQGGQPGLADEVAVVGRGLDAALVLYSDDPEAAFLGSGFVWHDGRHAVTNAHVVGDAQTVLVADRRGGRVPVRVLARDAGRDIAVLGLPDLRPGLPLADGLPRIGTPVVALGAPMGLGFTATSGIVAAAPRQVEPAVPLRLIQHDAALNPGSSGGPLIDRSGRLVGMNSRIADGSRLFFGISYAISAADLARLVPALLGATLAPVPALGLDLRPVDGIVAAALGVPQTGVLVDDVLPGAAAGAAGVRAGDILLSAQGRALHSPGDLAFALDGAGTDAGLRLWRDGQVLQVRVSLAAPVAAEPDGPRAIAGRTLAEMSVRLDAQARVTGLAIDSAPGRAGLVAGDRILRLNGRPVSADDLGRARPDGAFVLLLERDARHLHVIVDPGSIRQARRPAGGGNRLDLAVARF